MFHLRRAAFKALASKPTASIIVPKTRTFVSIHQSKLRPARQWVSPMQRRWASDDAATQKSTEEQLEQRTEAVEEAIKGAVPEANQAAALEESASGAASQASRPRTGQAGELGKTLYVGNLFFEVKEAQLEEYYSRFGSIKNTKIIFDPRGLSKGFGYVEFHQAADAQAAIDASNQQVFQGRRLAVQMHRPRQNISRSPRGANPPSKTLFIGNMSFEMSDKDLSDLFRDIKNVIDVRIAIDRRTGQPRGFAHADFIDEPSATNAKKYLEGKELYGRVLRVDYSASTTQRNDQAAA